RQIRSDDVKAVGQERDEVPEHMTGARETVQQQQLRGARCAGLAIEDLESVRIGSSILDGGHGVFPLRSAQGFWIDRYGFALILRGGCQSRTTTIIPPALLASRTRCASWMSSKRSIGRPVAVE